MRRSQMIELFTPNFNDEDDSELWQVAIEHILIGLERIPGTIVEMGRCSHWLRPHQSRWTADGGFAWPTGYGGGTQSRSGLPQFDWSAPWKRPAVRTKKSFNIAVAQGRMFWAAGLLT